jgi:putative aminopeptidase FrvX
LPDAADLLRDLVALPGPPGQEGAVRAYIRERAAGLGLHVEEDAKGNLLACAGDRLPERPAVVVTAHLDEIALLVSGIDPDGALRVLPLGGVYPWKWGEGPVEAMASRGGVYVPGILSLGSIHTTSMLSPARQAREGVAPTWDVVRIVTGRSPQSLDADGIRPGTRVVLARSRRTITDLGGDLIASYFLDDRADLVAWLLALAELRGEPGMDGILWAATASEEVGGEGALFLLQRYRPDICIALEIGPTTPDAPFPLDATPTVWVTDSYATSDPRDLDLLHDAARDAELDPLHWQAVTRGGSDASCAASHGLCARPVTLAFAAENSHGCEIMHRDAPTSLARLLVAYLRRVLSAGTTEA